MPHAPERHADRQFRAPAVPLVTIDPYFSIWSMADHLYDDHTRHWTTSPMGIVGLVTIDGAPYRFCGRARPDAPHWNYARDGESMSQTSLRVDPLSTRFVFEAAGVALSVTFTSPLLLDDLEVLSRPVSYVDFSLRSTDRATHEVRLYFDMTAELSVNTRDQAVEWGTRSIGHGVETMFVGTWEQNVLGRRGDDVRIDWGWAHLAALGATQRAAGPAESMRLAFAFGKPLAAVQAAAEAEVRRRGTVVRDGVPVLAAAWDLGPVGEKEISRRAVLAYEDVASIEYFGDRLPAYCFRNGRSFDEVLRVAIDEHDEVTARCDAFGATLVDAAKSAGGDRYADICALAYRQAIAAHKLVSDRRGNILFLSKECFSNGCIGTLDVTYPSVPLFLLYQPELVKGMLRPIFDFAARPEWPVDYAPHDVGTYPRANGQVYGVNLGVIDPDKQMPVEECGNIIILTAALARIDGNAEFAAAHWDLLSRWAKYLEGKGFDPANQLCTDDFAGHLAHNANLSVKTIVALAAFGDLCRVRGETGEARHYTELARTLSARWKDAAADGDHYKLAFDRPGSWSLKYNLVWDLLLGYDLFPKDVYETEVRHYLRVADRFGAPLDSRNRFTKSDWLVWAACLAEREKDFVALISPLWDFLNETPVRTPFCDWYGTADALERSFHNRTVVGGVFMKILKDRMLGA